jgi:uncharacterized protein
MKSKRDCVGFIKETFGDEKPLAKMVRSDAGYYLYDTGTNKILECRREVFDLLNDLLTHGDVNQSGHLIYVMEKKFLEVVREIFEAVDQENILRVKRASQFGLSDHFNDIEDILNTSVQAITLEVTEDCNLRCLYCIYNDHVKDKRNHSKKAMSLDVAKKAIRFLKEHSSETDQVGIGFYGGEPLLRFPFIKECVEYTRRIFTDQKVLFNITTNATLIGPEIAGYLLDNGFSILVSLDGPQIIHDQYRRDKTGSGSYEQTLRGLEILSKKHKDIKKGQISLNMVYSPPFSEYKMESIYKYLMELGWMPLINTTIVYPGEGTIPMNLISKKDLKEDSGLMQWAFNKYRKNYQESALMVKGVLERRFAKLMQRPVLTEPVDSYFLNGCCVPGQRKNFISVNGTIHVCEKISTYSPSIGDVNTGYDIDTIQKIYIDNYAERSIRDCSRCWGLRLCEVCYVHAFNGKGEFDLDKKRRGCDSMLKTMERSIEYFVTSMNEDADRFKYLYQYKLT